MRLFFNCCSDLRTLPDLNGTEVSDLIAARDHAVRVVQSLVTERNAERWRTWVLRVADQRGETVFEMPFWFVANSFKNAKSNQRCSHSWLSQWLADFGRAPVTMPSFSFANKTENRSEAIKLVAEAASFDRGP